MKKIIALALACLMAIALLAGCSTGGASSSTPASTPASSSEAAPAVEGDLLTGLAILTSRSGADATEDKDGNVKANFTTAAVLVDGEGKLVDCKLDVLQTSVGLTTKGEVVLPENELQTKQELKEGYNMKGVSGIGKEWYEQANFLVEKLLGMTSEEIAALEIDEAGKFTSEDLLAGCTVTATDYIAAITTAMNNATACGAVAGDKLGLGVDGSVSGSKAATEEKDGKAAADVAVVALTTDANGVITSSVVDYASSGVAFSADAGAVTGDVAAEVVTKHDLKEGYNMKGASPIGLEWYEQIDGFMSFMAGKTVADVAAAITDGRASDADLAATCTIDMTSILAAVEKAGA